MGNLAYETHIQHTSHPHRLMIMSLPTPPLSGGAPSCAGCNHQSYGLVYACTPCNFMLHIKCAQMPPLIAHPRHSKHNLTLFTKPIYPAGYFHCDGCGQKGNGFSYHCHDCDVDLHILCAAKPLLVIAHHLHHHQLGLAFKATYDIPGFSCDICGTSGNHWLYRCNYCSFDAHIHCATASCGGGVSSSSNNGSIVGGGSQNFHYQQQQSYSVPIGQSHRMFSRNYQYTTITTPVSARTAPRILAATGRAIVEGVAEGVAPSGDYNVMSCDNGFDYDVWICQLKNDVVIV